MGIKLALAGNPNSGKTTMFNALTGSNQYVGNRPGVTVECKTGELKNHKGVEIVDLPGIYSLSPYTAEEIVSRDYIIDKHPNAIINLVDASNIERNLYLTTQLCETGFPVVIALNMIDLVRKNGDSIDVEKLSKLLDCEIIETSALKQTGLAELSETAVKVAKEKRPASSVCRFSKRVEDALDRIQDLISDDAEAIHIRWFTVKVFERDEKVMKQLTLSQDKLSKIERIIKDCEEFYDDDSDSIIINERYNFITNVVRQCVKRHEPGSLPAEKIDNIVTNRILALPIFVCVMAVVYYVSIQLVGGSVTDWLEGVFENLEEMFGGFLVSINTADWLVSLVVDGLLAGVLSVISFVPQLIVLFLFLALLEDCGYMARIAFIMDRVFRKFGLSGKSFIPLLVASGCGVPGIMACRTIESDKDRMITIMVTTFVPCGAKLPIIALISGALFNNSALVALSVYLIGVGMVFLSGLILKKTSWFKSEPAPFVMELPSYHIPSARNVVRHVFDEVKAFIVRAGTIIFVACGVIWFLSNFSWDMRMVDASESILATIGGVLAPIFSPLGFGQWQMVVSSLTGIVAKENIVSSLQVLYDASSNIEFAEVFTKAGGFSFLVFNMLCSPCVAAIATIKKEMGGYRWMLIAIAYQTIVAYLVAFSVYNVWTSIASRELRPEIFIVLAIVAFIMFFVCRPESVAEDTPQN